MADQGDAVTTLPYQPARSAGGSAPRAPVVPGVSEVPEGREAPMVPGYELGALVARGGTSEVWAGVALDGGRRVAVKVVHADLGSLEAAAREAAVSARAASAHVVAVEACVPLADGRVAVVMPHLLGGAVDALVRARGHLSPGEVVTVLAPMASALGRLHDLGVVHGDVSPGNLLLDLDGRPVLGDLGLGHVVGDASPGVWGTDGYVAPEVLLGADPAPASDVYALGAVGWLCLTGSVPGQPGLRPELAQVNRAGAGSEPLVRALAAAVSADPGDRPSAHELAWLLFGSAEPEPLRLVHGDDEVSAVTYRLRAAAGRPPTTAAARRRWRPSRLPGPFARSVRAARPVPWQRSSSGLRYGGGRPARWRTRGRDGVAGRVPSRSPGQPPEHPMRRRRAPGGRHAAVGVRRGWGGAAERRRRGWWRVLRPVAACALLVPAVVALLVLTVAGIGRQGGAAQARPSPAVPSTRSAEASPSAKGGRLGVVPGNRPADPRLDADAPRSRPAELLGVLAEARAAAWRHATAALLDEADAPGSAAAAADAAAVSEVARVGLRYTGLRYTVAEVATVSSTSERAVLRARVDAGPYVVTSAARSTPRPAVRGEPVLIDLVRTTAGWRVADLRPAP